MSQKKDEFDILEFAAQASKLIEKNFKLLLGIFIACVVGGGVWSFTNYQKKQSEMAAFTELYKITKIYQEKKAKFDEAKAVEERSKDPKAKVADADQNKNLTPATGNLEQDYPEVTKQLAEFIDKNAGNNASGEAALTLSEIYDTYNKPEQGATTIDQVLGKWGSKNVLYYVMQMRAGDLYASSQDCEKAISFWQVVANSKSFIAKQAQLKLGVCLQKVGRMEEAKQWFTRLQEDDPNSAEGFSAKRYLRFLKFKSKVEKNDPDEKAQAKETKQDRAS